MLIGCEVIGSEYLGPQYSSGEIVNGILHEDIGNLSFKSDWLDMIVSNEILACV